MQVRHCFDVRLRRIQVVEVARPDVLGHLPLSLHSTAIGVSLLTLNSSQGEGSQG